MKNVAIAILLFLATAVYSQDYPVLLKPFPPAYVHQNEPFEVSCIPRTLYANGADVEFFILSERSIELTNVVLRTDTGTTALEFTQTFFPDYFGKVYKISGVRFIDSSFIFNTVEIVCTFSPNPGISQAAVTFGVNLKDTSSLNADSQTPQFAELIKYPANQVKFFEEQTVGGSALNLVGDSEFLISPRNDFKASSMMMEFWASIDLMDGPFLLLRNRVNNDTLVNLQVGDYYFLRANSRHYISIFNEHYIGNNTWDYFNILINPETSALEIYVNELKFAEVELNGLLDLSAIDIEFFGQPGLGLHLDKLILWDFHNELNLAFENKHYVQYKADSSAVLYHENFDDFLVAQNEQILPNFELRTQNASLVKSEAPLFSRAPELNVVVYQNFYSIEWVGNDVEFAESFIVEKSFDGSNYSEIYYTDADNSENQTYFFSDPKDDTKEVIYYRVKQTNLDESTVYSSRVKIGQGEKEYFSLNQNHPNPFNPITSFSLEVFEEVEVEVAVYNIVGKKVEVLHEGPLGEGLHTFSFDGSELPSGIYFYEAKSPFSSSVKKMILAK